MNYVLISAEKINNKIHLMCDTASIIFTINENDSLGLIIEDMIQDNLIIINIKFLILVINIFLKPNNRIYKIF